MQKSTPPKSTVKPAALIMPQLKPRTRSAADAWLERQNPLTRLSMRTAQQIYDTARNGNYARLQYIYAEIEKTDPTLLICVERRLSALGGLGWRVITTDDTPLAKAQKERLQDLLENAENLSAAIEHLGLAFFRGHSFAAPYMKDGRLAFELPPSWEFNFDPFDRQWYHNPLVREGDVGGADQTPFDPDECLHLERVRAIDYPALAIFLRHDVAEDQWGRFLERYGIPPVILEMPPMTSAGDADRFAEAARNIYEALCGAVPNGTHINTLAEARGTDPFSAFIEHQEKTLVRLCTGGTLGSIAEAGSGTLAGNAQADVWREIVRRDAVLIGDEFTRYFARKLFPNDCRVKFELGTDRTATPDEMFDLGAKAKTAGYRLTKEYLETETGCTLEDDPTSIEHDSGMFNNFEHNTENAQTLSLNGAQIQSIVETIKEAAAGAIPVESVKPMLKAAFPQISEDELSNIMNPLINFKPTVTEYNQPVPTAEEPHSVIKNSFSGGNNPPTRRHSADTPLQNAANRLQNAPKSDDEQVDPLNDTPSQTAEKRPNKQMKKEEELGVEELGVNSLTEALEKLFEKTLAEAAAEELEMKGNNEQDT